MTRRRRAATLDLTTVLTTTPTTVAGPAPPPTRPYAAHLAWSLRLPVPGSVGVRGSSPLSSTLSSTEKPALWTMPILLAGCRLGRAGYAAVPGVGPILRRLPRRSASTRKSRFTCTPTCTARRIPPVGGTDLRLWCRTGHRASNSYATLRPSTAPLRRLTQRRISAGHGEPT